jgi:DNA gyrase subunit A
MLITTSAGQSIRFKESDVRAMGRAAAGVRGIRLGKGDVVSSMEILTAEILKRSPRLLTVMANGFGKQTPLKEYRLQSRGGSGIKTAQVTAKTGPVVAAHLVEGEEEILALSAKGQIIRTNLATVRVAGRATQGVKVMTLHSGDKLVGITCL